MLVSKVMTIYTLARKGVPSGGSWNENSSLYLEEPNLLHEIGSAKFDSEETYCGVIIRFDRIREEVMQQIDLLHGTYQEQPFL
jgi:hypothetical protein